MSCVRAILIILIWLPLPVGLASAVKLSEFMPLVPPAPNLELVRDGHASEIVTTDRTRVGGLLRGQRPFIPYEAIPARVKFAFLAAEDDAFFEHEGYDFVAIARAFLRNKAAGRVVEGGSTLSQQIAKVFVSNEKSYNRKIIELFLARRIEARYTKADILETYLNQAYLGAGAYGVQAASEIYFNKNLDELTWPEATLLAGITTSPTALNPFNHPERTLERRRLILKRMVMLGSITEDEARAYHEEPLVLRTDWDGDADTAPYAAVEVREHLKNLYGEDAMEKGSLRATISVSPVLQDYARHSVARGLRAVDRRQGYRGPLVKLPEARWDSLDAAAAKVYGIPAPTETPSDADAWKPVEMRPYLGLVREVGPEQMEVTVGGLRVTVHRHGARWAFPYDLRSDRNATGELEDMRNAFEPGDVIVVAHDTWQLRTEKKRKKKRRRRAKEEEEPPPMAVGWRLDQIPKVEGMLLSTEIDTGYVRAVVGGWDFDRSQFNRAIHGCRQPGSVFKPIVYSRALEHGLTPATILSDTPIKILKAGGEVWQPKNADRKFSGFLLLRDALARSRNLPSVEVFNFIGAKAAAQQAYRLGITTPMAVTEALSLGASCVKPWDLARVYGTFARRGVRMDPQILLTVETSSGQIELDRGHFSDPSVPTLARVDRMMRSALNPPRRVIPETHAFQTLHLLRSVVMAGTAGRASTVGVPVAGKTGTTNAYDTWFVGFSESMLTEVWVGADDNDRPVGRRETGGRVALPIWLRYMKQALKDRSQGSLLSNPPSGLEMKRIDRDIGLLSKAGEPGLSLPFVEGTAPEQEAPDRNQKAAVRVDRQTTEF